MTKQGKMPKNDYDILLNEQQELLNNIGKSTTVGTLTGRKMPTIEEQRKQINTNLDEILDDVVDDFYKDANPIWTIRQRILRFLSDEGCVLKAERELQSEFICDDYMNGLGFLVQHGGTPTEIELDRFVRAMGYTAVEPLIGEEHVGRLGHFRHGTFLDCDEDRSE